MTLVAPTTGMQHRPIVQGIGPGDSNRCIAVVQATELNDSSGWESGPCHARVDAGSLNPCRKFEMVVWLKGDTFMSPPLPMSALGRPVDNYVLQSSQRRPRRGTSAVFAALEFRAQFIFRLIDDLGSASSDVANAKGEAWNAIGYCLMAESAASPVFTEAEGLSGNR